MDGFSSYSSLYDTSSLLQFCNDDSASAASSLEVSERISSLEQRVQMQEDEIQLLKSALADVVRRLNLSEEQEQSSRRGATKARPMMATLPQRASVNNGSVLPKKKLPSPPRNTPGNKSSVRRTNSHEHVGLSRKDSSESKGSRARAGSTGSNRSDSRNKDPVFNADEGSVRMFFKGRPVTLFLPKDLLDDYSLEARAELPSHRLKLSWVYGYRGRDCRSNLHLLPTGETLYFLDAVVVLFNVEEQLQRHYTGHTSDIKCLAVHPDKITIATGQGGGTSGEGRVSPQVRVWDSVSLNTLHVLGSGVFERGLACVSFSKSNGGNSLCAVDDSHDHVLSVWDWQREERLAEVKSSSESVFAADFHPTDSNLVVTCGKSHLNFWSLEKHTLVKKQGLFEKQDKPRFVLCLTFAENGDTITGDSSGNILVWSKGSQRISRVISGAHDGSIFSLTRLRNGTLVSGGKDRRLVSWDLNYTHIQSTEVPESFGPIRTIAEGRGEKLLIGTTKNFVLQGTLDGDFAAITQGHTDELWGLAVHPCRPHFLTCGSDRQVCLWDSTHHHVIWTKVLEDSAQSAAFHPNGSVVAIGTTSGRWLVLDSESKDLVTVHTDGNEQLSVMSFCPDGNFLAIGSHDNYIYIYAVSDHSRKYSRVGKCVGHSSCVTHLDWSCDSQYLMSNSGDYEILYWIPSVCKQLLSVETSRDVDWSSNTCTLGFHVLGKKSSVLLTRRSMTFTLAGTWPDGGDGADIRASSRSRDQTLLVTGDDSGQIRLFSYPCCQARAPSHLYAAHSSHVTNISFLCNDTLVVSTGDASVMQWSVL